MKKITNGFTGEFLVSYRIKSKEFTQDVNRLLNGELTDPLRILRSARRGRNSRIINLRVIPLFDPIQPEIAELKAIPYSKLTANFDYTSLLPQSSIKTLVKNKHIPKYKPKKHKVRYPQKSVYTPDTLKHIIKALDISYYRLSKMIGISANHTHLILTNRRPLSYAIERSIRKHVIPKMNKNDVDSMPLIQNTPISG